MHSRCRYYELPRVRQYPLKKRYKFRVFVCSAPVTDPWTEERVVVLVLQRLQGPTRTPEDCLSLLRKTMVEARGTKKFKFVGSLFFLFCIDYQLSTLFFSSNVYVNLCIRTNSLANPPLAYVPNLEGNHRHRHDCSSEPGLFPTRATISCGSQPRVSHIWRPTADPKPLSDSSNPHQWPPELGSSNGYRHIPKMAFAHGERRPGGGHEVGTRVAHFASQSQIEHHMAGWQDISSDVAGCVHKDW